MILENINCVPSVPRCFGVFKRNVPSGRFFWTPTVHNVVEVLYKKKYKKHVRNVKIFDFRSFIGPDLVDNLLVKWILGMNIETLNFVPSASIKIFDFCSFIGPDLVDNLLVKMNSRHDYRDTKFCTISVYKNIWFLLFLGPDLVDNLLVKMNSRHEYRDTKFCTISVYVVWVLNRIVPLSCYNTHRTRCGWGIRKLFWFTLSYSDLT